MVLHPLLKGGRLLASDLGYIVLCIPELWLFAINKQVVEIQHN
jgi:hypothetical protein